MHPHNLLNDSVRHLTGSSIEGDLSPTIKGVLTSSLTRIQALWDLQDIFEGTGEDARQFMNADRVAVFQLFPDQDWAGMFVAESIASGCSSVLEKRVYDHCFGERFMSFYKMGRVQAVADIHASDMSACHAQLLDQFQVRANLVVPILHQGNLWGLLCAHQCDRPREWTPRDIEFIQEIAHHFGIAIQHAELRSFANLRSHQLEASKMREQTISWIVNLIRQSLDIQEITKAVTDEILKLLQVDRVGVFKLYPTAQCSGKFITESKRDDIPTCLEQPIFDPCFGQEFIEPYSKGRIHTIVDVDEASLSDGYLRLLQSLNIKANLVVPIVVDQTLWGLLCLHQCHCAREWESDDIQFIERIAEQFAVAVQQSNLCKYTQQQATVLEYTLIALAEERSLLEQQTQQLSQEKENSRLLKESILKTALV